jgi:hypothetical protein
MSWGSYAEPGAIEPGARITVRIWEPGDGEPWAEDAGEDVAMIVLQSWRCNSWGRGWDGAEHVVLAWAPDGRQWYLGGHEPDEYREGYGWYQVCGYPTGSGWPCRRGVAGYGNRPPGWCGQHESAARRDAVARITAEIGALCIRDACDVLDAAEAGLRRKAAR